MRKDLYSLVFILSLALLVCGCGKKASQVEISPTVQTQNTEQKQVKENNTEKQQPNALDYMAPGYRQSQEKIKQLQQIRQQAIDENNTDIENVNY